jgi:hypothetical protein
MRVVIALLWLVAIGLLICAVRLPTALDIYVKDRYFVISKKSLILLILVAGVLPLVAVTIRHFGSALH